MRHRGVHVGNFFLGDKDGGGAFTDTDEEALVLFASQAATAIAHARAHRDEQHARADLETLVETLPVGVVVLDAASDHPLPVSWSIWSQLWRFFCDLRRRAQCHSRFRYAAKRCRYRKLVGTA